MQKLHTCRIRAAFERKQCADCERKVTAENVRFYQWDHRDPATKARAIAEMVGCLAKVKDLQTELLKCDLVCYDCHRDRTNKQWQDGILSSVSAGRRAASVHLDGLPEFKVPR
jgi:hypothetical protein